jgi:hypothetical protein
MDMAGASVLFSVLLQAQAPVAPAAGLAPGELVQPLVADMDDDLDGDGSAAAGAPPLAETPAPHRLLVVTPGAELAPPPPPAVPAPDRPRRTRARPERALAVLITPVRAGDRPATTGGAAASGPAAAPSPAASATSSATSSALAPPSAPRARDR